jgi:PAS domain S-box-containing protein
MMSCGGVRARRPSVLSLRAYPDDRSRRLSSRYAALKSIRAASCAVPIVRPTPENEMLDPSSISGARANLAAKPTGGPDDADKVNILLIDDQPSNLLTHEAILGDLGEKLAKAFSAQEALQFLAENETAVVLIAVRPPEHDGFRLAATIRGYPQFNKTAIIFVTETDPSDTDRRRGYEMTPADYVAAPVLPDVLRAKVKVFADLFRKTRELEHLNVKLELHVAKHMAELEASNARLLQSEQGRSLALAAGQMGSWDWDVGTDEWAWDEGQYRIFGLDPKSFKVSAESIRRLIHPEDLLRLQKIVQVMAQGERTRQTEFRALRPNGEVRWCMGTAAATVDATGRILRISGVTVDVTERREAEERLVLLAREVDHRARNALAIIQSIIRLSHAKGVDDYVATVEGRIRALARAHTLLSDSRWLGADLGTLALEELAPYRAGGRIRIGGPDVSLQPATAQGLALALHELATNAAKHGALSAANGRLSLTWKFEQDRLVLRWAEEGGPKISPPSARSFGLRVIRASVEQQLGGETTFDWSPAGLRCTLSIPRNDTMKPRDAGLPSDNEAANNVPIVLRKAGKPRVLLVEDEALVAMMIQESLKEFGYLVVGPVATAAEALAAAQDQEFDAALLDINLGDGMVYKVADVLAGRRVPFVFVTGYDADSVDSRFSEIPVLQKPIEREMLQKIFVTACSKPPKSASA